MKHGVAIFRVLLMALFAGLWIPQVANAQLTVRPEATTIHETDTFDIDVQAVGVNVGQPDFAPFERDFEILSSRSSSQYKSINGRVEAWTRWKLTAKPRRTGRLTLPALELDGHRSAPVQILVKPLDSQTREIIDSTVFFEVEASPRPVYVQAQLVVTRRLFYADGAQLYGDIPAAPDVADAIVQTIGEPRSSSAIRNGRRYGLIEQRFAIFPERSGRITIPAVTVTGSVRLPPELGARRRTGVRVRSKTLEVDVLPIPSDYPSGAPWLPAQQVEVLEVWDAGKTLALGTPVQRSLMVRAEGAVASIIPPLDADLPPSVRGYPDPPELRDAAQEDTLVGTRIEAMSLVPGEAGVVALPAVRVIWFDTTDATVRTARLDPRQVEVVGSAPEQRPVGDTAMPGPASVPSEPAIENAQSPAVSVARQINLAHILGVLLAIAALGWSATGWRLRVARQTVRRGATATPRGETAPKEPAAFRAVIAALDANDAAAVSTALTDWSGMIFGCAPDRAARALRQADPDLPQLLDRLNMVLYAPTAAGTNAGLGPATYQEMRTVLSRIRTSIRASGNSSTGANGLPPLYPSRS